ncbi:MAG: hypothetical protein HKP17_06505 [Ignavibacteriaceae bacterium]|nr:hypothetical protein [Ignavibacteriaceae bacterium]
MKKKILFSAILFSVLISNNSSAQTTISSSDFKPLIGSWSGTLTYLNYSDGTPFSMPVELRIVQTEETNNFTLYFTFPDEPEANSAETVSISDGGTMLNGEPVISKQLLEDGNLEIVTESMGADANEPATIRQTYIIGAEVFVTRKDVLFEDQEEWLNRNEFNFKKDLQEK